MRSGDPFGPVAGPAGRPSGFGSRRPQEPAPSPRRRWLVPALGAGFCLTTLWAAGASYYLLFHDDVLARFLTQQRAMQYAYEERVGALQLQLDRAASERLVARNGIETRLTALTERQALIETRQGILASLASGTTGSLPAAPAAIAPVPAPPAQARKPFPTPEAPELRMRGDDRAEAAEQRIGFKASGLESRLDGVIEHQSRTLAGIAVQAQRNAERFRFAMLQAGIEPARFERKPEPGLGGPLVPVPGDAFERALAEAQRATAAEERMRRAATALPFRRPLAEEAAYTSGFGTRIDPFTRGLAMHTGLDLRADHGTAARATAPGRVTAAEYAGGYGNMVEVDHGHGVATRYAHLSGYAVAPGQRVEAGTILGRVGSTGRSTGNHLHYETRIDGEPVDPQLFLRMASDLSDLD